MLEARGAIEENQRQDRETSRDYLPEDDGTDGSDGFRLNGHKRLLRNAFCLDPGFILF
jgi:hypothetical protein